MVIVHFINPKQAGVFSRNVVQHTPRVGDELRFSGERYFIVKRVVWCYDEPKDGLDRERANVEIEPAP